MTPLRTGALVGVIGISFSAIFVRLASVSPATAAFFRTLYAVPPLLLLILLGTGSASNRPNHRRDLAVMGGLFFGIDLILFHTSIAWIGAGLATLLVNTQVVFVAALGWLLHGERPGRLSLAVIPVVLAGMAAVSGFGRPGTYGVAPIAGTAAGIGAGAAYAAFLITFRSATREIRLPVRAWLDATLATGTVCLVYGLLAEPAFDPFPGPPSQGWLVLLAMVVQVGGWLLITRALPGLPALDTSLIIVLQPVFALFWGWLIFGETLSALQGIGTITVVGGILVLIRSGAVQARSGDTTEHG